ncbi:MAG: DUF1266 domain-containing protein [Roseburia sp.]|nr:DUF1266 domain-containing protein [Roseburia sp.]MDY5882401.1 DUF1266 domain-containing protein [Roseburia sp.]
MEKMEVRVSLKKRVLVTLIPLMCMVGVILDASLELFMEYSPLLDAIERDIFFLILGGAILSIPFIIKVNRKKITVDGNTLWITPAIGCKKSVSIYDVKICSVGKKIKLYDDKSYLMVEYEASDDPKKIILNALQRNSRCRYNFFVKKQAPIVANANDMIVRNYIRTGEVVVSSQRADAIASQAVPYDMESVPEQPVLVESEIQRIKRIARWNVFLKVMIFILFFICIFGFRSICLAILCMFLNAGVGILKEYRIFNVVKRTYYRVDAVAVSEEVTQVDSRTRERHVMYEFMDKKGQKRRLLSDSVITDDIPWGSEKGERKYLWYSPLSDYLLDRDELKFHVFKASKKLPFGRWLKKHFILAIISVAAIIWIGFQGYKYFQVEWYEMTSDGRKLQLEWSGNDDENRENAQEAMESTGMEKSDYEEWLKYAYYPYFHEQGISEEDYEKLDIKERKLSGYKDDIEDIKENLEQNWGIYNRSTLIKVTNSVLEKGDKYTYEKYLEKMNGMDYDPTKYYQYDDVLGYEGADKAYKNIGDAGVDSWDYCRCIRMYAMSYVCGYISYDEYLLHSAPIVKYLQNEYTSWEQMYESYYYGYLVFNGRIENKIVYKTGYKQYTQMAYSAKVKFK